MEYLDSWELADEVWILYSAIKSGILIPRRCQHQIWKEITRFVLLFNMNKMSYTPWGMNEHFNSIMVVLYNKR